MGAPVIYDDPDAVECGEVIARLLAERDGGKKSLSGMHSVGGWHTSYFKVGIGWLGEAFKRRIERAGITEDPGTGACWANILPRGSEYKAHAHKGCKSVAVWCLADSGGALCVENADGSITTISDRAGRLALFDSSQRHWVPTVEQDRFTVAANLRL